MTSLCAWCELPLEHSWIKVGNVWIHAHCLDEVALETEAYLKTKQETEEVYDYLYAGDS